MNKMVVVVLGYVLLFNQIFQRKNLIKIMNVGERAVGRAGAKIAFPEHNSATFRNI